MNSTKTYSFDYTKYRDEITSIVEELKKLEQVSWNDLRKILTKYPKDGDKVFSKNDLIAGIKGISEKLGIDKDEQSEILAKVRMKPTRTQSGVTPVTVLTKPFPCPGKCIFCPSDVRMPKSYLADEPGAQRAARNRFDPYLQTYNRLKAYRNIGHNHQKVELIVLGGTWSFYPKPYQIWFIKRCFEAINDFGDGIDLIDKDFLVENESNAISPIKANVDYNIEVSKIAGKQNRELISNSEGDTWESLFAEHEKNEKNACRCVGLTVETRPDNIDEQEVIHLRKLGCTKIQLGFQNLNDDVLEGNKRGHDVNAIRNAVKLLRWAGFKIHAHWMANLYRSTVDLDIEDYKKLFGDKDFRPDELKVYPCSLIETAELMDYFKSGEWKPYSHEELLKVVTEALKNTPEYCRLTRVIRDIPSDDIVTGNKLTNFRQIAEADLAKQGIKLKDIRSREIKDSVLDEKNLSLKTLTYESSIGKEVFLQYVTEENKIVAFLRLCLPDYPKDRKHPFIDELDDSAIIREIHVYGSSLNIGDKSKGKAQHLGLGRKLIEKAKEISKSNNYSNLAVISAIGTREYYKERGFITHKIYQNLLLT